MKRFLFMLLSYLKVGVIGFGGGSALIPVIEKEIVLEKKLLSPEAYNSHVVVANITPGTLPVKLAAAGGAAIGGAWGMILSAIMVSLPGVVGTIFLVSVLSRLDVGVLHQIEYLAVGVAVFIIFLLVTYIKRVIKGSEETQSQGPAIAIIGIVFMLTAGKELHQLLGIEGIPLMDLSSVNVLLMFFFTIFYTGGIFTPVKVFVTGSLLLIFLLCTAKSSIISLPYILYLAEAIMLILSVKGAIDGIKSSGEGKKVPSLRILMQRISVWILLSIAVSIPALMAYPASVDYLLNGFISTVISFGGGEAYLTIADSIFVSGEFISNEVFYSQLLPVANALPGPILSKMLAGVGYYFGLKVSGSMTVGWFLALGGYGMSLAGTCLVFFLFSHIYTCFETLPAFKLLKKWVLPVICGLLLTTIVSMIYENLKIMSRVDWPLYAAIPCLILVYYLINIMHRKFHFHDLYQILICGGFMLIVLNFSVF